MLIEGGGLYIFLCLEGGGGALIRRAGLIEGGG